MDQAAETQRETLTFADLDGWSDDDHTAALSVFRASARHLPDPPWPRLAALAERTADPRGFFESQFRPCVPGDGAPSLITGYFEPELPAAGQRSARFRFPIFAPPPELDVRRPWARRSEIETEGLLSGRGLELAWLEDPVEVFFLQVQGSGRLRLPDGSLLRVGFAARNGQPYRSIGAEMVRLGLVPPAPSAQMLRDWLRANPERAPGILHHNPSFVFFRILPDLPDGAGPVGTLGVPLTAGRSLAVDATYLPLGAPVWIESGGSRPFRRLMVAQDTGSAITGPHRADIFTGTGDAAGDVAGRLRVLGRLVMLLPKAETAR